MGYVEDLLTKSGRKRYVKMAVPNLSVLPKVKHRSSWEIADGYGIFRMVCFTLFGAYSSVG